MTDRLKGRIAIVTGSDSGIGQAIVAAFAAEGADVVITYLHDREGAGHTQSLAVKAGRRALVIACDQREPQQVSELFRRTEADLGTPDILVNNAAVNASGRRLTEMTLDEWDNVIRTDLYGPFYCCWHFARLRRARGGRGRIINVTSVHEEIPMIGASAYDAAKGGLRNLTRTLALELAPDRINVNNIAPGMILTPMNQEALDDPQACREQAQHIPWKRPGTPAEVAQLALYLASDDADYATGQTYFLDGGLMLNVGQGA
jgi:glucose 1-dehydrogenase